MPHSSKIQLKNRRKRQISKMPPPTYNRTNNMSMVLLLYVLTQW